MNGQTQDTRGYGFMAGLAAGACVGVGLAMWLVPRAASELRARAVSSAKALGQQATAQLDEAGAAIGDVRDELVKRGRGMRDDVADAVATGADEVGRFAMATKSDGQVRRRSS